MSRTLSQTEAQALVLELDALRSRAQRIAGDFGDLAFSQVVGLLETARVTMINRMHADDQAKIDMVLANRPRRLEGHGRAALRRVPEEQR